MSDAIRTQPRRLRVLLRDYRMLEAGLALPAGQSLLSFLAGRKTYLTLHDAAWVATGERMESIALRTDRVLWIAIVDEELPLVNGRMIAEPRDVEILLEGGMLLSGGLSLAPVQRVPDYLDAAGPFIAIRAATLIRSGRPSQELDLVIGDIAINHEAVQAAWEAGARQPIEAEQSESDAADPFSDPADGEASTSLASDESDPSFQPVMRLEGLEGQPDFDMADADSMAAMESLVVDGGTHDYVDEQDTLDGVEFGFTGTLAEDEPGHEEPSGVVLGIDDSSADDAGQDDETDTVVHRSEGWV